MVQEKYGVQLSTQEKGRLRQMIRAGRSSARAITRARILLKTDQGWTASQVAAALDISERTVFRAKRRYAEEGLDEVLRHRNQVSRYRKLDDRGEAHLIALACSPAPEGHDHWTLRLLAGKAVELGLAPSLSHETVRLRLKKNALKPWRKQQWCIPKVSSEFVATMEDVLDLYVEPRDPERPVVCFDETSTQLLADVREPLPAKPGRPRREDYEYQRAGTRNLFLSCEPRAGWRHVAITKQRTMQDFAHQMRWLVDEAYPDVPVIRLVLDNLNTHRTASLYETFPPAEARRIAKRLEFHHTPKHGSWLNMAEIEFSVLARACLKGRNPDKDALQRNISAYEAQRNTAGTTINWRFTAQDARAKMRRLYPDTSTLTEY